MSFLMPATLQGFGGEEKGGRTGKGMGKGKDAGARQRLRRCHWRLHFWGKKSLGLRRVYFPGFRSFVIAGSFAALF
jgi:hypothetical protein